MNWMYLIGLATILAACGGDDRPHGECVAGSSDRYLPIAVGNSWSYETYAADAPAERFTKSQIIAEERNHPDDGLPVFVQDTDKETGSTINWLRFDGDALVRLQQEDYDINDTLERTTVYDPQRIRLDETPDRVTAGATFQDSYTEIETDAITMIEVRRDIVDLWSVIAVDEPCPGEFSDLDCLHVSRGQAGLPPKDFWYTRGLGKVREEGGQVEQLLSCSLE